MKIHDHNIHIVGRKGHWGEGVTGDTATYSIVMDGKKYEQTLTRKHTLPFMREAPHMLEVIKRKGMII